MFFCEKKKFHWLEYFFSFGGGSWKTLAESFDVSERRTILLFNNHTVISSLQFLAGFREQSTSLLSVLLQRCSSEILLLAPIYCYSRCSTTRMVIRSYWHRPNSNHTNHFGNALISRSAIYQNFRKNKPPCRAFYSQESKIFRTLRRLSLKFVPQNLEVEK